MQAPNPDPVITPEPVRQPPPDPVPRERPGEAPLAVPNPLKKDSPPVEPDPAGPQPRPVPPQAPRQPGEPQPGELPPLVPETPDPQQPVPEREPSPRETPFPEPINVPVPSPDEVNRSRLGCACGHSADGTAGNTDAAAIDASANHRRAGFIQAAGGFLDRHSEKIRQELITYSVGQRFGDATMVDNRLKLLVMLRRPTALA